MNSMELNKIAAAILLAGVITMTAGFMAQLLLPDDAHVPAERRVNLFAGLAPETAERAPAEAPQIDPISPILATMDFSALVEEGERVSRRCAACHTFEQGGPNRVGPNLANMVDRDKATKDGFNYSNALAAMDGTWTYEALNEFLFNPRQYVPGTTMSFAGLRNTQERAAIVAYMRHYMDSPPPLPEVQEAEPEAAPDADATPEAEPEGGQQGEQQEPAPQQQ